jgi:hypothetical protein
VLSLLAFTPIAKAGVLGRAADAARTFVVLNTAALVAFMNFASGKKAAWNGNEDRIAKGKLSWQR